MTGYSDIETNYSGNYKKMDMKKTKVALVTASHVQNLKRQAN